MIQVDGKTYYVPGVYTVNKIVNASGTSLPAFNVGVIIAPQQKGTPYVAATGATPMLASDMVKGYTNLLDLKAAIGADSVEAINFFNHAKKQGAGMVYFIGVNPNTKLTGAVVGVTNTITVASKDYGAHVNDIQVAVSAGGVHTIIPPKKTTLLTADSGTGNFIYVKSVDDFVVGESVFLTSNVTTNPVSYTIAAIDAAAKKITFTTNVTNLTTANYARIYQQDTDNQEVSTALTTSDQVNAFYAASKHLAVTAMTATMPTSVAATYVQNLTGATKATSVAASGSDWQAVADNFLRWNEEFAIVNKYYLRVLGLVTSDSTNHASFAALATAARTAGRSIAIVTGVATGDYALAVSNAANPIKRAFNLNTDEIQLAGFGLDGLPAVQSLAGQVFGIRIGNSIKHNQTNDLIYATTVEKAYSQIDTANLEPYIKGGVIAIIMTKDGYKLSQGTTTYQNRSVTFDPITRKTYLVRNRDIADFDSRVLAETLEPLNGSEEANVNTITNALVQSSDKMFDEGYIKSYKIVSVKQVGNTWELKREIAIDSPTDFFGVTNTIVVN